MKFFQTLPLLQRLSYNASGTLGNILNSLPKLWSSRLLEKQDSMVLSSGNKPKESKMRIYGSGEHPIRDAKKEVVSDGVDECVKETHLVLREVHQAIFDEQVFDLVNREAFSPSPGINVTGLRENYLQLGIGQGASVFLSLIPSGQDVDQAGHNAGTQNLGTADLPLDTIEEVKVAEEKHDALKKFSGVRNPISYEIYLQQIFLENVFLRAKDKRPTAGRTQASGQPAGDGFGLLGHFCISLAHRMFSNKVLAELENLIST